MRDNKLDLTEALKYINPASLSYQDWMNVGFALKHEGYSADVWENWSAQDTKRYHPGECRRKWDTFLGSSNPVTGGTIVQMAIDAGWQPSGQYDGDGEIGWDDAIGGRDVDELKVVNTAWMEERDIPAPPANMDGPRELIRYLSNLFEAAENVGYVTESYVNAEGRHVPTKGAYDRTAGQLIEALNNCKGDIGAALGDYDPETGAWIRFNPLDGKGVKNDNVTEYRFALVESDTLDLAKQYSLMLELKLPIAVMVHSGGKSIHAIVRIEAQNYEEYRKRVDYLYEVCQKNGMELDRQNRNPSRLSRMPGVMRNGKPQYIIAENVGCENFVQWKEYIEGINDDLPDIDTFDMQNIPELAPELIRGILRHGHKLLLSGPSKAGKSYALIELCIAIAEGRTWLGMECDQGSVLYINLELDKSSCMNRFRDVYRALGWESVNSGKIDVWNLRGKSCPMDKLVPKLIRRAKQKRYIAIIIDPIYKVITGDENSADQMSLFCNQFDKICTELGCSVIYCHHHSKGSQGQKRSMDRASGSGVFARDPDALLDLIELPVSEAQRDNLEHEEVRRCCTEFLDAWKPGWRDTADQTQQISHVYLSARCADIGNEWFFRNLESRKKAARQKTAWRIEGVLREFAPMEPRYMWFEYPVHRLDDEGKLSHLRAEGEKRRGAKASGGEKLSADEKFERDKAAFDMAVLSANGGEPCTLKDLGEYYADSDGKAPTERTLRNWITKYDYWIDKNTGFILQNEVKNSISES
ncbi:MAG: AAA family ATPase [Clostridia bacterium]|nr:AAA family ATPase [Clostridia bacterium]